MYIVNSIYYFMKGCVVMRTNLRKLIMYHCRDDGERVYSSIPEDARKFLAKIPIDYDNINDYHSFIIYLHSKEFIDNIIYCYEFFSSRDFKDEITRSIYLEFPSEGKYFFAPNQVTFKITN